MKKFLLLLLICCTLTAVNIFAQTGKISGTITDKATGEPLIGANVIIEGAAIGGATDLDGFYVILNVPPGTYNLKASYLGYSSQTITGVVVNIDQTTTVDIELAEQSLETQEVLVVAAKIPPLQKDVAASRANISSAEIEQLPTVSVNRIIGLQAGVEQSGEGVRIRGGSIRETSYLLNGISMRDERNNTPYTNISVTAIENVQVTTGGFSAQYGDLRSGLVNIATREGSKSKYSMKFITRYKPAAQKHFGISPHDPNSYWIKPFLDPDVAWTGTKNGAWDAFTQQQFPEFEGWNSIAQKLLANDDPNDDLSPEAAQRLFLWEHRKQLDIEDPDYEIDMSVSGPVPGAKKLGNLRFLASYRRDVEQYLVPLSDDAYRDWSGQLKLTADLAKGMKIMVDGLIGESTGTNDNNSGNAGLFRSAASIASQMDRGLSYIDTRLFSTDYWAPSSVKRNSIGIKFTHVVNPTTFYEVILSNFNSEYSTNPGRLRDETKFMKFGNNYFVDEAPFGFQPRTSSGINGMRMGVGMSNSRDSSKISVYSLKFDISSQIDKYNEIKAGVQLYYTRNKTNYANFDEYLPSGNSKTVWDVSPVRAALYLQDKLEFEGMIATLGVRFDYFDANTDWWNYEPWTDAFEGQNQLVMDTLLTKSPSEAQFEISPRIGIAFPISIDSKLYFNYGHMRSFATPENLYLLRRRSTDGEVIRIANPNNPLEKTIQYELGYEHNIADEFLLRVAGYYKNVSLQPLTVNFVNRDGNLSYSEPLPNLYQDIRGFEVTLSKNRGDWIQGFINYTYDVRSSGRFGYGVSYESPQEQREYERITDVNEQSKPVPAPYARANISILTPREFGPELAGFYPFADWRVNLLGEWRSGFYFTWAGGGAAPGVFNNTQWKDSWNFDLRLSKAIEFGDMMSMEFIIDMSNVFNFKQLSANYGFVDGKDYEAYMRSLHLPSSIENDIGNSYINIPGDDKPGEYRKSGEFTPIVTVASLTGTPQAGRENAIYWERSSKTYYEFKGDEWVKVEDGKMKKILDNKQYIDMPNLSYFSFLNPRMIYFGLKLSVTL